MRAISMAIALVTCIGLAGCEDTMEPEPSQAAQTPAGSATVSSDHSTSGSSLGSARDSAKKTVNDLEQRSEDLAKQFEDLNGG